MACCTERLADSGSSVWATRRICIASSRDGATTTAWEQQEAANGCYRELQRHATYLLPGTRPCHNWHHSMRGCSSHRSQARRSPIRQQLAPASLTGRQRTCNVPALPAVLRVTLDHSSSARWIASVMTCAAQHAQPCRAAAPLPSHAHHTPTAALGCTLATHAAMALSSIGSAGENTQQTTSLCCPRRQ